MRDLIALLVHLITWWESQGPKHTHPAPPFEKPRKLGHRETNGVAASSWLLFRTSTMCDPIDHAWGGRKRPAAFHRLHPSLTSSVRTLKLFRVLGPKVLLMATSAASRPRAINT